MSRAWVRGLPTSPIMSAMGRAGVTRFGSVVSYRHWEGVHALGVSDHGLAGVTRSGFVVCHGVRS